MSPYESTSRRPASYLAFMLVLGLAGWCLLFAAAFSDHVGPEVLPLAPVPFAIFFVVIIAARTMAFRIVHDSVLALDSAFYVAAAVSLGSVVAGWLVALALTIDPAVRHLGRRERARPNRSRAARTAYVIYFGGMTGALLMSCAWLFQVEQLSRVDAHYDLRALGTVIGLGTTLLVAHYAAQGLRMRLRGARFRTYLSRVAARGMLSEASLLPLAAVLVIVYDPERPLALALLGATYILINFVFNRLSRARGSLERRVADLETLGATARQFASSLQLHELVEAVARETLLAVPEAEVLTLARREGDVLVADRYDRRANAFTTEHIPATGGPFGHVIAGEASLSIADVRTSDHAFGEADRAMRSWMGVPITMYGRVEAVLAVCSRELMAFGASQQRLLESLAVQVSIALQNAHLYELAMIDGLTGLYVRRYFDARLDEEIERARRYETGFAVAMIDLDNFKDLNDTHGHQVGDEALRQVSEVVRAQMRGVDTAARYGGEEIALVLPRTELVDAYALAERIRAAVAELEIPAGEKTVHLTSSFGIAAFPESGARDADDLVRQADKALYRAKRTGKDRVELYWPESSDPPSLRTVKTAGD